MDTKSTIKIQDEYVHVDLQLLIQRLVTPGTKNASYRMSSITNPVTIPQLCLSQSLHFDQPQNPVSKTVQYVLYGEALLHQIPWTRRATCDQIFEQYSAYVIRKYDRSIVVLDGYSEKPSTKDCAHMRRSGGTIGVTLQTKKEEFLSNRHNKQ